tara:strand:- start:483 stop:668 length:186 start_codon:yes stop_codon:yes gene_type:complete
MTEEQIFQKVYNVYLNYEQELANRGMEDVQSIASHLTMAYMVQLVAERLPVSKEKTLTVIE